MQALLGPSGAGKSTLMDILALRKSVGSISGRLLVNGQPASKAFIRKTAYVPQVGGGASAVWCVACGVWCVKQQVRFRKLQKWPHVSAGVLLLVPEWVALLPAACMYACMPDMRCAAPQPSLPASAPPSPPRRTTLFPP